MTKSLTEQWKDGELDKNAYYYFKDNDETFVDVTWRIPFDDIECLAPVPSYEEYKEMDNDLKEIASKNDSLAMECGKLEQQLAIATKALNDILNDGDDYWDKDKADKALTKMEGVK